MRAPARSATAPRTGALKATMSADVETALPHHKSPWLVSFPTTISM